MRVFGVLDRHDEVLHQKPLEGGAAVGFSLLHLAQDFEASIKGMLLGQFPNVSYGPYECGGWGEAGMGQCWL